MLRFSQNVDENRSGAADDDFEDYLTDVSRLSGSKVMAKPQSKRSIKPPSPMITSKGKGIKLEQDNIQSLYSWARVEETNPFIRHVLRAVKEPSSLVLFTGRSAKHIFDIPAPSARTMKPSDDIRERLSQYRHLLLNHKQRTRRWSEIARLVSETHKWNDENYTHNGKPVNKAVNSQ